MKEFELNGHEYIELNKLLKLLRFVGSGGEAHMHIDSGEVLVNGMVETQRRKKLRNGDKVEFMDNVVVVKE
jgi:ribosome-associated protein